MKDVGKRGSVWAKWKAASKSRVLPWLWLFVLTVAPPLVFGQGKTEEPPEGWSYLAVSRIPWRPLSDAAFEEARRLDRPLFVLVFADWCHWCHKYETETLETEAVRTLLTSRFIPVAVDHARQPEVARRLGARLVPTSIVLAPDGRRLLRFYGFIGPRELVDVLGRILERREQGEFPAEEGGDASTCCPLDEAPGPEAR